MKSSDPKAWRSLSRRHEAERVAPRLEYLEHRFLFGQQEPSRDRQRTGQTGGERMKTVVVSWTVENRAMPPDTEASHHFHVGLGLHEADVPLNTLEHTFSNVEPGSMACFMAVCAEDGTELAPPITY